LPITKSPISFCAPASMKASASRSWKHSISRSQSWPTRPLPCRSQWTAPACCTPKRILSSWRR
jgi:hypothetical protein